jgi:hypothetical protein
MWPLSQCAGSARNQTQTIFESVHILPDTVPLQASLEYLLTVPEPQSSSESPAHCTPVSGGLEVLITQGALSRVVAQAALPFKSKPKLDAARRQGATRTLDQKRAVVMEPHVREGALLAKKLL